MFRAAISLGCIILPRDFQEQRLKLRSTEILQSHIRSYLVRKKKKNEERALFDSLEGEAGLDVLLRKFLFFYDPDTDRDRKVHEIFGNVS